MIRVRAEAWIQNQNMPFVVTSRNSKYICNCKKMYAEDYTIKEKTLSWRRTTKKFTWPEFDANICISWCNRCSLYYSCQSFLCSLTAVRAAIFWKEPTEDGALGLSKFVWDLYHYNYRFSYRYVLKRLLKCFQKYSWCFRGSRTFSKIIVCDRRKW